jgi:hypothetical protein
LPAQKIKKRNQNKKKNSPKPPLPKKNQPAILHGLRKPGGQARKQKTMRSTTKLGTKNKPISFKIDFENFFCKNKNQPPSLQSALHLTPIKRKNKNEF